MYNPYEVVKEFEEIVAKYAGAKYGVAVESCSAAILLCCLYKEVEKVEIPKHTYPSVPSAIILSGGRVKFRDEDWEGVYELRPYKIYDGALRFCKGMYKGGLHCLSFHIKKRIPIGRGGMILTNSKRAYEWFKQVRFCGRHEVPLDEERDLGLGFEFYMQPEQAVRGIELFSHLKDTSDLPREKQGYPDLSLFKVYK